VPVELSAEVPRDRSAPMRARDLLRARFAAELGPSELKDAEVVVSELVSNALLHGDGAIRLRLDYEDGVLRGEVIDDGPGFEAEVRERGARDFGGRGLWLVAKLARRWGVHDGSSHVWFELARPSAPEIPRSPELGPQRRPEQLDEN
jgi:anti-sigma regulatory factor (Ser/Thr protein kinase)